MVQVLSEMDTKVSALKDQIPEEVLRSLRGDMKVRGYQDEHGGGALRHVD